MGSAEITGRQLAKLAAHLLAKRSAILERWQEAVRCDAELTSASSLPRTQFFDHIPDLLADFAERLRRMPGPDSSALRATEADDAAAHGLQRWQQGYDLREVTREWGHLQLCVMDELDAYAAGEADVALDAMAAARRALAQLCNGGISESTSRYFQLRQDEAAGNVRDLEQALRDARQFEQLRSELWREAAHDLRGNLGVVANATSGLTMDGLRPEVREKFFLLLRKNVASLHAMLDDVTSLARLEAGHEQRKAVPFDAAELLCELVETLRAEADARGLYLKAVGPASLRVTGDGVKVRRIAQNLLLNALKYTQRGGVVVGWGDSRPGDAARWMLTVRDTGPGFHAGPGAPLAGAIEQATEEAERVERNAPGRQPAAHASPPITAPAPDARQVVQVRGEGIGLSIVKRLCELLDASVEMESESEKGTELRVLIPRSYEPATRDGDSARR